MPLQISMVDFMKEADVIKMIGKNKWKEFQYWMKGQTVGVNSDGSIEYYENDVQRFIDGNEVID